MASSRPTWSSTSTSIAPSPFHWPHWRSDPGAFLPPSPASSSARSSTASAPGPAWHSRCRRTRSPMPPTPRSTSSSLISAGCDRRRWRPRLAGGRPYPSFLEPDLQPDAVGLDLASPETALGDEALELHGGVGTGPEPGQDALGNEAAHGPQL